MTILEAIKFVLEKHADGLTSKEITNIIEEENLYIFKAAKPVNVVNSIIRRHCYGLDFPSANIVKYFYIKEKKGYKNPCYCLLENQNLEENSGSTPSITISSDVLPEEHIQEYYNMHLNQLQKQLLEQIMNNPPAFFEQLVVDLLLKLGYGYSIESGKAVGRPHDGGIDGIINEDALGLDKIYIQAKRYNANNRVRIEEVKSFGGTLLGGVKKGVFITTSSFTDSAIKYVSNQSEKSISLIDGNLLTKLMIKYKVGIHVIHTFEIFSIDTNYFREC